jgi:uncharacterized protein YchJ
MGIEVIEDRHGIFKRLLEELNQVPTELLPADEREHAAYAWALGAVQRGYKKIDQILGDRKLKARILDDFDDDEADQRLRVAKALFSKIPKRNHAISRFVGSPGRNEPCPCGSGNKYKKCCL